MTFKSFFDGLKNSNNVIDIITIIYVKKEIIQQETKLTKYDEKETRTLARWLVKKTIVNNEPFEIARAYDLNDYNNFNIIKTDFENSNFNCFNVMIFISDDNIL